jgi:hypothetical protein
VLLPIPTELPQLNNPEPAPVNDEEVDVGKFGMAADFVDEYCMIAEMSESEALEPRNLKEARSRPDWLMWEKAIHEELAVLKAAGTWELVDAPAGANVVGSKWVFRAKKDAAGNVVRYKARLVAQGFSQVPGVDYFDTFAPVARLSSIQAVLAMAAVNNHEIHQIDIKGAYLNGKLTPEESIFMKQPPGYPITGLEAKVCHLNTLYGLKQSGRRWYQCLVKIMKSLSFLQCEVDQAVFYRRKGAALVIVLVHVDDCTIVASSKLRIDNFKMSVAKQVEITDLGELHWILGIEVRRERENKKIFLSQRAYLDSILRRYGLDELKPVSLPMETSIKLTSAQSPSTTEEIARMRNVPYHEAVGSLMYASLGTRPDITYAVQTVSRFTKNPGTAHWDAVKHIFRYLKGTRELWLAYGGIARELTGYADADGNMAEDRHAISGYALLLHGGAVSWTAKCQEIISLSTTESEYIAATYAAKEALWLCSLISQLFDTALEATTLFFDNQSAIALTKDHQYHARTKHICKNYTLQSPLRGKEIMNRLGIEPRTTDLRYGALTTKLPVLTGLQSYLPCWLFTKVRISPCIFQQHRRPIPFYSLDRRERIHSTHLLPNRRYGCGHSYESTTFPQSQTFRDRAWAHIGLRGSVRIGKRDHELGHVTRHSIGTRRKASH